MTGPPERERRPGQGGAESRGGRRLDGDFTPPPPDHDYDEKVTDPAEVVTTDPLTADDVIFTFGQWLNKDIGSSMYALLSYIGGPQNIEKVDDSHIRLHLQSGNIGVPEHLFEYPALVLHRSFAGDIVQQPLGTGAFTLQEYAEGERAVLKRRPDYWRNGADGQPLPYLDEILYVNLEKDAAVAALQSGQIDSFYDPRPSDWQALG